LSGTTKVFWVFRTRTILLVFSATRLIVFHSLQYFKEKLFSNLFLTHLLDFMPDEFAEKNSDAPVAVMGLMI
jgi:hypothetical protein